MHEMSYDPARALLHVVKRGFWTLAQFEAFVDDFMTMHRMIRRERPDYRAYGDCRDYAVQSPEVSAAYTALFDRLSRYHRGRFAIVVPTMLARIQAKRAMPHAMVEVFTDPDEAMRWLTGPDEGVAA